MPEADEYSPYYARYADDAAEKAAEQYDSDSAEYDILQQGESGDYIAWVKASEDAEPKKYDLVGESVPTYHAREASS